MNVGSDEVSKLAFTKGAEVNMKANGFAEPVK